MNITFLGAARNVTGSRFLIEYNGKKFLIDCGLFQERDFQHRNWDDFPVNPAGIDAVLLTHAHIDHCGYLPKLVREGFHGPIYCTLPTADITTISLLDSAKLQKSDAENKKKRHKREGRKGKHPEVPLYTAEDVEKVFSLFKHVRYNQELPLLDDLKAVFYDAGHILGSAMIEIRFKEGGMEKVCVFSGDIGRNNRPILDDPHLFDRADYVVMEATYGDRVHEHKDVSLEKLRKVINETKDRGGNVIIPAFAIERVQEILYYLNQLVRDGDIPPLKTFVDSPMAADVTRVFTKSVDFYDEESLAILRQHQSLFDSSFLRMTKSVEDSKAINDVKEPVIIMAGSGMCTGGRIKHHLVKHISRPENTILFVGYQAFGTLGRQILEKPERVRILGETYPVKARIEVINGFSGHADKEELLEWIGHMSSKSEKVFIVHSEEKTAERFAETLRTEKGFEVIVPQYQQRVAIGDV